MKIFFSIFVLTFSVISASAADADFTCSGIGLRISQDKALYGNRELVRCGKVGVAILFSEVCDVKSSMKFALQFDEISNNIVTLIDGKERFINCYKKN